MGLDAENVRILLVEDAPVMRKLESKALKNLGFQSIVEAGDGDAAIEKLKGGEDIDLIISDWNMPNKDGYELLVWVRNESQLKDLPFLMATGQSDKKQEKKAIEAGVSSFVAKPFNEDELRKKIEEAFGLKTGREESTTAMTPRKTATGKVVLRVGHIQITDHLILGVLKHLIDKKEFQPRFFELETECMGGWNPVQKSLEEGQVDAAFVLAPIAMDLFGVGTAIKLVLLAHKSGSIFVRNRTGNYAPPFKQFFKNKSFYIPHKMSVHHLLAHTFFSKIGLKPGMAGEGDTDVNFEVVAPVQMPEFLQKNAKASGFMVAEPLGTKSIASGIAELQFLSSELWENHPCCVVAMRDEFIADYSDAVYEFVDFLVRAGKFVQKKPEMSAEIGVSFLDPKKTLGLKAPILKNVLTEAKGIKTDDLFPDIEGLRRMNRYMHDKMGIGSIIDVENFVDTRFAEEACKDRITSHKKSVFRDSQHEIVNLLNKSEEEAVTDNQKSMLDLEGKYLTFDLGGQEYGIDILKIKEIIGMQPVRSIPQAPAYMKGVINLRGKVIPVMDLKMRFDLGEIDPHDRNCIVVMETRAGDIDALIGLAVDTVSDVTAFKSKDIEPAPSFGGGVDTRHILAMAKSDDHVKLLLNVDHILEGSELIQIAA